MPESLNAREIAATILNKARIIEQFTAEAFDNYAEMENKAAVTDLIMGVLRNRRLIDIVIEKVMGRPVGNIKGDLQNIIRIAVYELVYCPQTADYAIVNEAVNCAAKITNRRGAGFVNWILRSVRNHIVNRSAVKQVGQVNSRKIVPQSLNYFCEFDIELLPDRNESKAAYLGAAFSLPDWLIQSWLDEYGSEKTMQICFASNRRPSVYLRPNMLKTTTDELADKLKSASFECEIAAGTQMIKLMRPGAISELPGFKEGLFVVQDLSAGQAVSLLHPQQDWMILDMCSAPGTKTTQLAEATWGKAKIIATDTNANRLKKVTENIKRLGLSDCVRVVEYQLLDEVCRQTAGFDCILVDAPCSNTGVLARRPEVRYRIKRYTINKMADKQMELLLKAASMLKPAGVICYSTCSLEPQENRLLIKHFLENNKGFNLQKDLQILPSAADFDRDGSYTAILAHSNN